MFDGRRRREDPIEDLLTKVKPLCQEFEGEFEEFWDQAATGADPVIMQAQDLLEDIAQQLKIAHLVARLCWLTRAAMYGATNEGPGYLERLIDDFEDAHDSLYEASHIVFDTVRLTRSAGELRCLIPVVARQHMLEMVEAGLDGYIALLRLVDEMEADAVAEVVRPLLAEREGPKRVVWFLHNFKPMRDMFGEDRLGRIDVAELARLFPPSADASINQSNSRINKAIRAHRYNRVAPGSPGEEG